MAASSIDVVGPRPITFTDSTGHQQSVPLSGLEVVGSKVQVSAAWQKLNVYKPAELVLISAIATAQLATGQIAPPPVATPLPAIVFSASTPGSEGNGIKVTVNTEAGGTVFKGTLDLKVAETDSYPGLTTGTDVLKAIGVDQAPAGPSDPRQGTGLVQVVAATKPGAGLPADNQVLSYKDGKALDVKAADNKTVLFLLVPRPGYGGSDLTVKVGLDPGGTSFTVTATYAPAAAVPVPITALSPLPAPLAFVIAAAAPPSGLALPPETAATVSLAGGAPGVAATGVAFTA
jgi:hypothetical protein